MLKLPNRKDIDTLKENVETYCVSAYVPNIQREFKGIANKIELKNLISSTANDMLLAGFKKNEINNFFDPLKKDMENPKFYPPKGYDLVVFISKKHFDYYHIPSGNINYLVVIKKGYFLEPLAQILNINQSYILLSLNHNNVKVYEGDYFSISQLKIHNFPASIKSSLAIDEYPKSTQTHTVSGHRHKKSSAGSEMQHGHYNPKETDKEMLLSFFRLVEKRIRPILDQNHYPLILAGAKRLIPIYKKVNNYKNLVEEPLIGNFEKVDDEIIKQLAIELIGGLDTSNKMAVQR